MSKYMIELSDVSYQNVVDSALHNRSNEMNRIMKGVSLVTVVVLPFTIIVGMMGMNVNIPFEYVDSL